MKGIFNKILITCSVIVGIIFISKLTGIINYAFIPTGGNEPTIKKGSFLIMTNLLPYEKNKFIAYNQLNPEYPKGVYLQRFIADEEDMIQIINGVVYVNEKNVDNNLNLNHAYKISSSFANELIGRGKNPEDIYQIDADYCIAQLNEKELDNSYFYERYIAKNEDTAISKIYGKNWNADNFGPLKVPHGKAFFIGDNRNASLDSRYLGFVDKKEIVGRLILPKK